MQKTGSSWHVRITCPNCYNTGKICNLFLGSRVVCKSCKHAFRADMQPYHPRKNVEAAAGAILLSPVPDRSRRTEVTEHPGATRCPSCHCEVQFPEDYYRGQARCPGCALCFPCCA